MTAVLAALLGAFAAGYISYVLTRRRDRQKEVAERQRTKELEHREKVGLLKLVHTEVTNNLEHLKAMDPDFDSDASSKAARLELKSKAWEQSRTKLAELVDETDLPQNIKG